MSKPRSDAGSFFRRFAVGGVELAVGDHGRGEPIVLLHGFPFDGRMWRRQIGAFDGFRLLLPDLRGHGMSEASPPPYPMEMLAEDIRQLMDHLGIERAVLGGQSMGGYVSLAFAARYPERLHALLLIDTRPQADSQEVREKRADQAAKVRRDGVEAITGELLERLFGSREVASDVVDLTRQMMENASVDGVVGALTGMASRPDSTALLPRLECPTFVLTGSEDTITPPDVGRAMAAAIPGAEWAEIPGAGHLAPLEQPDAVNEALNGFLHRVFARPVSSR